VEANRPVALQRRGAGLDQIRLHPRQALPECFLGKAEHRAAEFGRVLDVFELVEVLPAMKNAAAHGLSSRHPRLKVAPAR